MNAPLVAGAVWALPWWLTLAFGAWRWRGSPSLDDVPASPPEDAPPLSVIVPARNEARIDGQELVDVRHDGPGGQRTPEDDQQQAALRHAVSSGSYRRVSECGSPHPHWGTGRWLGAATSGPSCVAPR